MPGYQYCITYREIQSLNFIHMRCVDGGSCELGEGGEECERKWEGLGFLRDRGVGRGEGRRRGGGGAYAARTMDTPTIRSQQKPVQSECVKKRMCVCKFCQLMCS